MVPLWPKPRCLGSRRIGGVSPSPSGRPKNQGACVQRQEKVDAPAWEEIKFTLPLPSCYAQALVDQTRPTPLMRWISYQLRC